MNSDYSDLRFTNASENSELGYWIYFANSTEVRVRVRIEDNLIANDNVSIYMYYDNPDASTTSDIADAHIVGEDCADCSEWTEAGDASNKVTCDTTDKRIEWANTGRGYDDSWYRSISNIVNVSVEYTFTQSASASWRGLGGIGTDATASYYDIAKVFAQGWHGTDVITTREKYDDANSYGAGGELLQAVAGGNFNAVDNVIYTTLMIRNSTTLTFEWYSDTRKDTLVGRQSVVYSSATDPFDIAFLNLNIGDNEASVTGDTGWLTNYSISKYVYPVPTYIIGDEEENTPTDSTSPNVTINTPTNDTYSTNTIVFNISAVDDTLMDACWYSLDAGVTNYTMTNVSSFYSDTNSSMTEGFHIVNFYCNDSSNNLNDTESVSFFIDSIPPYFITIPSNTSLTYNEDWNGVFFNASDTNNFDTYSINDTRFNINDTGYLINTSNMAYGNYLLNVSLSSLF